VTRPGWRLLFRLCDNRARRQRYGLGAVDQNLVHNAELMTRAKCELVRWVSNEPLPGWVEASLVDAHGSTWRFFDKPPIFTSEPINANTEFPVDGALRCRIVDEYVSASGRAQVEVETVDVDSEDGQHHFTVDAARVERE
jgi:hypothetical protein